ncbi:hypothetical protein M422DRAFT_245210 [Sphaerobolus stellatus SS14]|nr:hypothetical protein M422DRAFT_245210 [Sphaerobolus stellatus SS14]
MANIEDNPDITSIIDPSEVLESIKTLPNGTAAGLDGIPYELWKMLMQKHKRDSAKDQPAFDVVQLLTSLFNNIELMGISDDTHFNKGWMCPLYKKGDHTNIAIESLAAALRNSDLTGYHIPGDPERLIATLFADDTTVYLSKDDSWDKLQEVLGKWCKASGAVFNISKTAIIPIGTTTYWDTLRESHQLSPFQTPIPINISIASDDTHIWVPTLEKIDAGLERWNKGHPTLEGRCHIINIEIGARTQYLTRVQGMPKQVEETLEKKIRQFFWDSPKSTPVATEYLSDCQGTPPEFRPELSLALTTLK